MLPCSVFLILQAWTALRSFAMSVFMLAPAVSGVALYGSARMLLMPLGRGGGAVPMRPRIGGWLSQISGSKSGGIIQRLRRGTMSHQRALPGTRRPGIATRPCHRQAGPLKQPGHHRHHSQHRQDHHHHRARGRMKALTSLAVVKAW